jgi:outer membrane protein TolC
MQGCVSADRHERRLDRLAYEAIQAQREGLSPDTSFTLEPMDGETMREILVGQRDAMADVPGVYDAFRDSPTGDVLVVTLMEALDIATENSRAYQSQKEQVFSSALRLEQQVDAFRNTYVGMMDTVFSVNGGGDETVRGLESGATLSLSRRLATGAELGGRFAVDLAKLLTGEEGESMGLVGELTLAIPLLQGAGRETVLEPLVQARRDLMYAVYEFERFKQSFVVSVADEYLSVLEQANRVENAADNYRRLVGGVRRSARLAEAGRLEEIQVDQAKQDELRARESWIGAVLDFHRRLESFQDTLGLPPDVDLRLDPSELTKLTAEQPIGDVPQAVVDASQGPVADEDIQLPSPERTDAGRFELQIEEAVELALTHRLDLMVSRLQLEDAERGVRIARKNLQGRLNLTGSASVGESRSLGSADQPDARLRVDEGNASVGLEFDFPWERVDEAVSYRQSLLARDQAARSLSQLEDRIRSEIRNLLRDLLQARESTAIQARSVDLARRRVESTALFLEAGRAQIRDVLDAQEDFVNAQNSLTTSRVRYRVAELALQRDMGLLTVTDKGLYYEYEPEAN